MLVFNFVELFLCDLFKVALELLEGIYEKKISLINNGYTTPLFN